MLDKPSSKPLNTKPIRFGITGKIWLAISIMLLGYLVTMGQGALTGKYTREQHSHISDHLFPAALQAQTNLLSFKTQLDHFEYAILLGEPERLQTAKDLTRVIRIGLRKLINQTDLPPTIRTMGQDLILRHEAFSEQAFTLYTKMTKERPTEDVLHQALFLAETAKQLKITFQTMSTDLNNEMDDNLKNINQYFGRQQTTSLIIFVATVTITIFLVSYILAKTILKPLQKTVHLANLMAQGDLSQKVDINQQDEIGALANAMNIMADQIERSHIRMETIIAKRTLILRRTNEQLRIEVQSKQDAQQEIFTALDQAKQANEAKDTFLANMSHEIRTPMNGIIGMTGLLLETRLSNVQKNYLHTLHTSAQSLLAILNDILDFSKIESGQLQLNIEEFNLFEVVAELTDLITLRVQDMGLEFSTLVNNNIPPFLQGDQTRLRQILLNITDNAIKFTKRGEIALKIEIDQQTKHTITLLCSISDTGVGIAPHKLDNILQPFIQADSSTTKRYGGTGLGLAISNKLIQLMGGEIHVESKLSEGTTVSFTATFDQSVHLSQMSAYKQTPELIYSTTSHQTTADHLFHLAGKNVLIAEDESTNQAVLMSILQTYGISCQAVDNGQQALNALNLQPFDLILMDCQMPIMDGYETTKAIRKRSGKTGNIPIIALTANTSPDAEEMCLDAGMNDYLAKPIEAQHLKEYLLKWLQPTESTTPPPLLVAKLVLKRQGGEKEKATQVLIHAEQITQIYLEELQTVQDNNFPMETTNKLCNEVKKLGAHLGIAKLQNHAIHLQLALKNEPQQITTHAKNLKMSIMCLAQELKQAGTDYDIFLNS